MIFTSVTASMMLFRGHSPKWAFQPLSGAGAARFGGRFNRPGLHALYLALDLPTATKEFQQDDILVPPCTMVQYTASIAKVVDFRGGYEPNRWSALWDSASENWRTMALLDRVDPPSWDIAELVLEAGACGILFRSVRNPEGSNLVVYINNLGPVDRIEIYDPGGTLPRTQQSWE